MSLSLKQKIFSGIFWQGLDRIGCQGLQFIVSVILARLLMPEEFGLIAIISVFINFGQVFVDSGFSAALIQKKDSDNLDCNSVFYINIVMALLLYWMIFLLAPMIADFYHKSEMAVCLRILALGMVIRSFSLVQLTLLNKSMLFYLNCRISWTALIASGIIGIWLAYKAYGVWALIVQSLVHSTVSSILLCFFVKWRPQFTFDWQRIVGLFRFGWKIFCSSILDSLYNNLYTILIGRLFDLKVLSFYQRGRSIPMLGMGIINSTIGTVIFPAFSQLQHDRKKMRILAEKSLKSVMFFVIPVLGMLFVVAEPLVRILFTEKWLPCVIFIQLSCIIAVFWPLHTLNLQIITACGRSDLFLLLEIIKKIQVVIIILLTYKHGVLAMVVGLVISAPLSFIENSFFNYKLINYSCIKQIKTLFPLIVVGMITSLSSWLIVDFLHNSWCKLLVGGSCFGVIFLLLCSILNIIPEELLTVIYKRKLIKNV